MAYALFENEKLVGLFSIPQLGLNLIEIPDKPGEDYIWINNGWQKDRSLFIRKVKEEAQKQIIFLVGGGEFWMEKQMNIQARALELISNNSRSTQEENELNQIKALWAKIKSIRDFSNSIESGPEIDIDSIVWPV